MALGLSAAKPSIAQAPAAFVETRAHALDHTPLVAPVVVAGGAAPARVQLRTEKGQRVAGRLVRFTAALADERAWLAPLLRWQAAPVDASFTGSDGALAASFTAIVLDAKAVEQLPAGATSLWIEGGASGAGSGLELVRWSAPAVDAAQAARVEDLPEPLASQAAPLAEDPLRAWRIVALVEEQRGMAPGAL
ncbi:MAG: hypothetical protein D6824_01640, partial [Planctomycetota bacterium]